MEDTLRLALGLVLLLAANIVLGATHAACRKCFCLKTLLKGVGKGLLVVGGVCLLCLAGALDPDLIAVKLGGQSMNLMAAVHAAILAGWYAYAKQDLIKLKTLLTPEDETDAEVGTQPPAEPAGEDESGGQASG